MAADDEAAKAAWLARLDQPTWRKPEAAVVGQAADYAATMAGVAEDWSAIIDHVIAACDEGDQVACETLSNEDSAKQAWLAKLDTPSWGTVVPVTPAESLSQWKRDLADVARSYEDVIRMQEAQLCVRDAQIKAQGAQIKALNEALRIAYSQLQGRY